VPGFWSAYGVVSIVVGVIGAGLRVTLPAQAGRLCQPGGAPVTRFLW